MDSMLPASLNATVSVQYIASVIFASCNVTIADYS